jgi:hypothetical protein
MALLWDRYRLGERRFLQARPIRLRVGARVMVTNTVNLAVALAFTVMGVFVIFLANTGQMTSGPRFQAAIGDRLAILFGRIEERTAGVPEPILGLAVLALAAIFVYATLRDRRRSVRSPELGAAEPETAACHEHAATHSDSTTP